MPRRWTRSAPGIPGDLARLMAQCARTIHTTQADTKVFPDLKASAFAWLDTMALLLEPDDVALLRRKTEAVPDATTCVQFDLHGGNVMMVNGEPVVIDMGDVSYGSPLFDLGLTMMIDWPLVGICERVTKLPNTLGAIFLEHSLDHYFADLPGAERERFARGGPVLRVVPVAALHPVAGGGIRLSRAEPGRAAQFAQTQDPGGSMMRGFHGAGGWKAQESHTGPSVAPTFGGDPMTQVREVMAQFQVAKAQLH